MEVTISAEGGADPPGSADYVAESAQPDGTKVRHYVCRNCLEVFDAPEYKVTVHACADDRPYSSP